jgi:hypothetical protein
VGTEKSRDVEAITGAIHGLPAGSGPCQQLGSRSIGSAYGDYGLDLNWYVEWQLGDADRRTGVVPCVSPQL